MNLFRYVPVLFLSLSLGIAGGCSGKKPEKPNNEIRSASQLNAKEYRIGLLQGTAAMSAGERLYPKAKMVYYSTLSDAYAAVQYGKVDALLFDRHSMEYAVKANPALALLKEDVAEESIVIGAPKRHTELIEKVNRFIERYRADGTARDMRTRWLSLQPPPMPDIPEPKSPVMTLRVGTEGLNEPMNYYDKTGRLTGYDLELIKRLGAFLNARMEVSAMTFDALVPAAESGKVDLLIASLNATPERKKNLLFSDRYIDSAISVMVRKDRLAPEQKALSLDGKRVAVMTGSVGELLVEREFPAAQRASFDTFSDAVAALRGEKVDYVVGSYTSMLNYALNDPGLALMPNRLSSEPDAIAVHKGNKELLDKLNGVLEKYKKDGTLAAIEKRWLRDSLVPYKPVKVPARGPDAPVLRVAIAADREPICFLLNNAYAGLDCELIERIAYDLGMRVEYQNMKFAGLIASLQSGKADLIIANMTATAERAKSVDFTTDYFINPQTLLTRKALLPEAKKAKTSSGITHYRELSGKKVGVFTGTILDQVLAHCVPDAVPEYYNTYADQAQAVRQGKLSAFILDDPIARHILGEVGQLKILSEPLTKESYAMMFTKSNQALCDKINGRIRQYYKDGVLQELDSIWFGRDESRKKVDIPTSGPNGVLKIATNSAVTPFNYVLNGKIVGYEIDLISRIAKDLGYGIQINDMDFAAVIQSVAAGKSDVGLACLSVTEERKKSVLFSDQIYAGGIVAVVKDTDNPMETLAGKKVGILTGSYFDTLLKKHQPDAISEYFNNFADQIAALEAGKIAAMFNEEPMARIIVRKNSKLRILDVKLTSDDYAMVFSPERKELCAEISAEIRKMRESGELRKLDAVWFGLDESKKQLAFQPGPGKRGTLRAAVHVDSEPFIYSKDGQIMGYEVDLLLRAAHRLGYGVELVVMNAASLIPSTASGKTDLTMACITVTEERKKTVLFSEPTYRGGVVVLVKKDSPAPPVLGKVASFVRGLKESFYRTFILEDRYKLVLQGLYVTLLISVLSVIGGTLLGFGVCMMRRSPHKLFSMTARIYIRALQGTPILVLLMILYYVVFGSVDVHAVPVAILGFSLNFAAYASEMLRSGIEAVDKGQIEAAKALGFSRFQVFIRIVLPQAAKYVLPVFKGEVISTVKMTSVVGYIAIQDLTKISDIIRSRTYEAFFPLIATALIYFAIAYCLTALLTLIELKTDPLHRKRRVRGVKEQS